MAMLVVVVIIVIVAMAMLVVVVIIVIVAMAMLVVVMIIVIMAMAMLVVIVMMLFLKLLDRLIKSVALFHCGKNVLTIQKIPRCCHNGCSGIMLSNKLYCVQKLALLAGLSVRKNDARGVLDLIVVKLSEIFHVHFTLVNVTHSSVTVENSTLVVNPLNSANYIGKLANT